MQEPATFLATELAVVLSHYDLGIVESITPFPRGSRKSPKVGIVCERGKFLLKRRAERRARPDRVRIAHLVQRFLAESGFPAPRLIPGRPQGQTFLQLRDGIYELFEFVAGVGFSRTVVESYAAGGTLADFHRATAIMSGDWPGPRGDYHDATGVRTGLCSIAPKLSVHDSFTGSEATLASLVHFLRRTYDAAATEVDKLGLRSWPLRVTHSDWHPGNLLFRKEKVAAVVDYDSVRLSYRAVDVANGALQFSMVAGDDPLTWPDHLDEDRLGAFLEGYCSVEPLSAEELRALTHLMAETLIAECVPPITETGSVGRWSGYRVLMMVRRKLEWLTSHRQRLAKALSRRLGHTLA